VILIDTTVLVALCDPRDALHKTALRDLKALARAPFAVCEAVLAESCFHLSADSQRQRLKRILEELDVQMVPINDGRVLWTEVFDWLNKDADHAPDWADGYLAVLSGHDRKSRVWTYDIEFRKIWRRPNGSSIPMAVS
jgi:predicted nucleic acid-binding protein